GTLHEYTEHTVTPQKEVDMARDYRLMSSDGHLEVPPERWVHRVPEKYRDRAPRTVHLPDGGDALLIEGQPLLEANFLDLRAGRPAGQWQPFGLRVEDAAGTGSAEQRVQEQDMDGMEAEILFPAMVAGPVDMDMPVTVHVAFNRTGARASQPTFKYPKEDPEVMRRIRRPFLEWITNFGLAPSISIAQLVLAGVFERFPTLKVFFAETRLGWVPFWLEHADLWYQRHIGWAEDQLGFKPLKELPSTYVR